MSLIKKIENHLMRKFKQVEVNTSPEYVTEFKTGTINVNFDLEFRGESGDLLIHVDKLTDETVDLITKQYIFANKIFSEMDLEKKIMVVVASNRSEKLIDKLMLNVDFADNYLFHKRGITFKVVDFDEFKRVSASLRSMEELILRFKK